MKKKELEILLERLDDIPEPDADREQYATPATVAAELLHFAFLNGDIEGRTVYDLGCGNGILGIGAKVLGAHAVIGVDSDEKALEVALQNCKKLGVEVELRRGDVRRAVEGAGDTVVMNPPFGAQRQNRHADRVFLERALAIAPVVYSILNAGSEPFVRSILPPVTIQRFPVAFTLKRRFWFHKKDRKVIQADIYRIERT
jgi:putative methylase